MYYAHYTIWIIYFQLNNYKKILKYVLNKIANMSPSKSRYMLIEVNHVYTLFYFVKFDLSNYSLVIIYLN